MSDDPRKKFEIEFKVRDAQGGESVRHLEGPLDHNTAEDVAVDVVNFFDNRSRRAMKHVPNTSR